jgi:hypothetical protein
MNMCLFRVLIVEDMSTSIRSNLANYVFLAAVVALISARD